MKSVLSFLVGILCLLLCSRPWLTEAMMLKDIVSDVVDLIHTKPPSDHLLSTSELIESDGYPVEKHQVTTEDGYILTLFRIPHGKNATRSTKEPVIIQHGLVCSSDAWLINSPENTLPYLLADAGHDVWLGNSRGTDYSQGHTTLSTTDLKYWQFSFHEMGVYDVPAYINYIVNVTGSPEVSWVGHSMGNTMFFVAMDLHPELQSKVKRMIALAPVAYISHMKSVLQILRFAPPSVVEAIGDELSGGRILSEEVNQIANTYGSQFCSGEIPDVLCKLFISIFAGFDNRQMTDDMLSKIFGHVPAVTSMRVLTHYMEILQTGVFKAYGPNGHVYNLTNNAVPTLAFYGENDWLNVPQDAKKTISELGNVDSILVSYPMWTHVDFLWANDLKSLVYDKCVEYLST